MALVDVLAPTDFILNSPLGQADGQVNALAPPHSHCCPTTFDLVDFVGFLRYCEMKCPDFGQVSAISQCEDFKRACGGAPGLTFALCLPCSSTRTCGPRCCRATARCSGRPGGRIFAWTNPPSDPSAQNSRSRQACCVPDGSHGYRCTGCGSLLGLGWDFVKSAFWNTGASKTFVPSLTCLTVSGRENSPYQRQIIINKGFLCN